MKNLGHVSLIKSLKVLRLFYENPNGFGFDACEKV